MAQSLMTHSAGTPLHLRLAQLRQQAPCGKAPPETETYPQRATNERIMQTLYVKILTCRVDKWTHFVHNINRTSPAVKELFTWYSREARVSAVYRGPALHHTERLTMMR